MTLGCDLKALKAIKKLNVVDDMNNFWLWAQSSRYYEQLKVVVYMNDYRSWA